MNTITEDLKKRVDEMPADQWFTVKELAGKHHAGLWQHLCYMDDGRHRRADGCVFEADQCRRNFIWKSK